jgi:hypothetical protein
MRQETRYFLQRVDDLSAGEWMSLKARLVLFKSTSKDLAVLQKEKGALLRQGKIPLSLWRMKLYREALTRFQETRYGAYDDRGKTTMSTTKKTMRADFRKAVFKRAKYRCHGPGCLFVSTEKDAEHERDAHHITDRTLMPHGGYVKENGIALCASCHMKAEEFHATGTARKGWAPADLYRVIKSTFERAVGASHGLGLILRSLTL